jgi:predicted transcriptional regulator
MAEIMEAAKGGELKTRIMYMVNLSLAKSTSIFHFSQTKAF